MKRFITGSAIWLSFISSMAAQSVDIRNYWPQPAVNNQLITQDYTLAWGPLTKTILHRYVKRGVVRGNPVYRLDDYLSTGWIDAWEYRNDGTNILEVADFVGGQHIVYSVGNEILWGGIQNIGDVLSRSVIVDVSASSGVTAGYWNYGHNSVTYSALLPTFTNDGGLTFSNVLKLHVFQSWCANTGCAYPSGQLIWTVDYWFAPSVGIIQTDYLSAPAPFTARRDFALTISETWETP